MVAYVLALNSLRGPASVFPAHWLQTILSGAAVMFLAGLVDDFLNLKPRVKLALQIVACGIAFANGLSIDQVGSMRAAGLGESARHRLLAVADNQRPESDRRPRRPLREASRSGLRFGFYAVGIIHGDALLAFTALPLAGALLGFLVFNFNPATVFLGDSGALTIGFLLGCYGIVWAGHRVTVEGLAIPLLALCVPLSDLGLAIIRRRLKRQPIFSADRGHIHHRLLDRGLSVRRAALILYAVGIAGGVFGLLLGYTGGHIVLRSDPYRRAGLCRIGWNPGVAVP